MKSLHTALLLLFSTATYISASAQADSTKYKEKAAAVRAEVWAWKAPAFANRTIPAEYANESCVIMARRALIEADSKRRMDWSLASHRNFYYNSTVREMVKINDKVSLEEFSQLSYSQFKKLNSWMSATSTTFVGARIIKPNGTIKEINTNEAVQLNGGKNNQQRKLAIGDLQVGDILDYYVRVEEYSQDFKEPERLIFVFGDDHPILDYSLHCEIGTKYAVQYHSMNKAPEAQRSTNEDKDVILDIAMKNLASAPTGFWMASMRELPAFRLNVLSGGSLGSGGKGATGDLPLTEVLGLADYITSLPQSPTDYTYRKDVMDIIRNYDRHYNKVSKDSLATLIYYTYRFVRYYTHSENILEVGQDRNETEINNYEYLMLLSDLLKLHKISSQFVMMPYKHGPAIQNVMGLGDLPLC